MRTSLPAASARVAAESRKRSAGTPMLLSDLTTLSTLRSAAAVLAGPPAGGEPAAKAGGGGGGRRRRCGAQRPLLAGGDIGAERREAPMRRGEEEAAIGDLAAGLRHQLIDRGAGPCGIDLEPGELLAVGIADVGVAHRR